MRKKQLRDLLHKKGKKIIDKTIHGLKHLLLSGGHHRLPKPSPFFRPFSCASCREQAKGWKLPSLREDSIPRFSGKWSRDEEVDGDRGHDNNDHMKRGSVLKEDGKGEKGGTGISRFVQSKRGGNELAKKMKELEMEVGDMEHVLDIEEALHYYSRLTSPAYVEIVDQFFMDMHSDFTRSPIRQTQKLEGKK